MQSSLEKNLQRPLSAAYPVQQTQFFQSVSSLLKTSRLVYKSCKISINLFPLIIKFLISDKTTVNRINGVYLKKLNFSNKLQLRRKNLLLPFNKFLKKKVKNFGFN